MQSWFIILSSHTFSLKHQTFFDTNQSCPPTSSSHLLVVPFVAVCVNKLKQDSSPQGAAVTTVSRFGCVLMVVFSRGGVQRKDCSDVATLAKLTFVYTSLEADLNYLFNVCSALSLVP